MNMHPKSLNLPLIVDLFMTYLFPGAGTIKIASSITMIHAGIPQPLEKFYCKDTDFFVSLFALTGEAQYKQASKKCEANCEYKYQVFPRASALDGDTVTVDEGNRSYSCKFTSNHSRTNQALRRL